MDFAFDESTEDFRRVVREFASARLAPHYQDGDRTGRPQPHLRGDLARLGLLGLRVPAEAGGQHASAVATGAALEEVARADLNAAYPVLLCALVADILTGATAPAGALQAIASGAELPCLALTEPGHGSDAANLTVRAERAGDGWRLAGEKASVSLGAHADTAVVFARTGAPGPRGVSAFYVRLGGVEREPYRDLGSRAVGRASLRFDGVLLERSALLGAEGGASRA